MFFGGSEDEDCVGGRFFQGFEEGVEGAVGEHVYLIYDEDAVSSLLGRDAHLVYEGADVLYGIVGGSIELGDVERGIFVEGRAAWAFVAGFVFFGELLAVEGFRQNACTGGFADAPRAAEEEGLRQMILLQGVLQGL